MFSTGAEKDGELKAVWSTDDGVYSVMMSVSPILTPTKMLWAEAKQANGDAAFTVGHEGKEFSQNVFDKAAAIRSGAARHQKEQGSGRPNETLRKFRSLDRREDPLDFKLPIKLGIPTVTVRDIPVELQSARAAAGPLS